MLFLNRQIQIYEVITAAIFNLINSNLYANLQVGFIFLSKSSMEKHGH